MLKIFQLKLKRRSSRKKRIVTMPCARCGIWCKPDEMYTVGINDRKVRICKECLK